MAVNPFDYVKAINEKRPIDNHSSYTPFLSNRAFSYNLDTILAANEMNKHPDLPPEVQFSFMNEAIRKGRRYSAWYKGEIHPNLEIVMQFFNCSQQKALQALQVLTQENLKEIKQRMDTGGR
tara:strand:- start:305 stop:670 length:366 start_codon:yes stop_codon:yes gene_type:complete